MSSLRVLTVAAFLAVPSVASAHIVITSPTPRVDSDNVKEAGAPCGGPRGDNITQLTGGQMFTFEYDETVAHPGFFQLNFSMEGDDNWVSLDDEIPDQGGDQPGSYSHTFEVPDVDCTDCTFQFVQVMEDRNPPTNYYACIDVEITSSTSGTPDAGMGEPDMGMPSADMGTTGGNNNTGGTNNTQNSTNGTSTPGTNSQTNNTGAQDNYSGPYDNPPPQNSGNACATSPHAPARGALGLLLAIGGFFAMRRRQTISR